MDAAQVGEWALSIGLLAGIGVTAVQAVVDEERRAKLRVLTRLRARRAERAAVAASIDDPLFAPETIRASVQEMLATAESIWRSGNESEGKRRRNDLIAAWAEDRHRRIGAGMRLLGKPQIDVLRVVNRESESEDRAIVRVRLRIHRDPKASANRSGDGTILGQRTVIDEERWTLVRRGGRWELASVSGDPISAALVSAPIITSPAEDDERVHEAALRELADGQRPQTSDLDTLIDRDAPANARLRELSTLDDHFAPELLQAALCHVVEAWEELTYGAQRPLERVADGSAIQALMYPAGHRGRRLICDAELAGWQVLDVSTSPEPPRVRVRVEINAEEFTEGDATGGERRLKHVLVWTLKLVDAAGGDTAWRLVESRD